MDGSVESETGKLVYVSVERFINEVCKNHVCLVCAKPILSGCATREHIVPNWVLGKFQLHSKHITLPNGTLYRYGEYVVPCCGSCNALLNRKIEHPIQLAYSEGLEGVVDFIENNGTEPLFVWLSWIFLKTHFKDQNLRMHLDQRRSNETIAEELKYNWESLHHIYCLSRSPYTEAVIDRYSTGSLIIVPVDFGGNREAFDFIDLHAALTLGIAIDRVGVIAVFGDAGAVLGALEQRIIDKIEGPLNFAQFRELVAQCACCHLHLKDDPKFMTATDSDGTIPPHIICQLPPEGPKFEDYEPALLGSLMDRLLGKSLEGHVSRENFRTDLRKGELSFLFNDEGAFNHDTA